MAWLQTSFTSHQLLVDSNSNKKGTKSCASIKSTDPDKSNTPLLCDISRTPENEEPFTDWLKSSSSTEKKSSCISPKSNFLSQSFFDKSSSKSKPHQASAVSSNNTKKPAENQGLLWKENEKKNILFNDDDEEADEDSDDEWFIPRMGGYQKVRPSAE